MKFLLLPWILISLISCSQYPDGVEEALELAKANRKELETFLNHYKNDDSDSLKLKYQAAVFLVQNMPYHQFNEKLSRFDMAFDSINTIPVNTTRRITFESILGSMTPARFADNTNTLNDIEYIDSKFLIDNLELAFEAWGKIPSNKRASFEQFCKYILPYRNYDEPLERNARRSFFNEYSWVYKKLERETSLKPIIDSIIGSFDFNVMLSMRKFYPVPLSTSQVEKSRLGLCGDAVNYFVNLFRALGIICTDEFIPQWGNHYAMGHSWIYIKYGEEEYATDIDGRRPSDEKDIRVKYAGESLPKAYRRTFERSRGTLFDHTIDVTSFYTSTIDLKMPLQSENIQPSSIGHYTINVFNAYTNWRPVAKARLDDKELICKNVGVNVLYIAGYWEGNKLHPVSDPFFVGKDKSINFFPPTDVLSDSIPLLRKYGLSSPRRRTKVKWITSINDGIFEGSNDPNFENAVLLYKVTNSRSTHMQKKPIKAGQPYRFVRFNANKKTTSLAELVFFDADGDTLKGKIIKKNIAPHTRVEDAFDDNQLTYCGGVNFSLGYEFPKPEKIGSIAFQPRNDGNHIQKGDLYNLYYWDETWVSLGQKLAKDTVLYYNNVPKNSLLLLKNVSRGIEEHVFTVDKDLNQIWLGFDNHLHAKTE